jgi:hypothetical protein
VIAVAGLAWQVVQPAAPPTATPPTAIQTRAVLKNDNGRSHTTPYEVLREFIREQAEAKASQDFAVSDLGLDPQDDRQKQLASIVRNGSRVRQRLSASVARLQEMQLQEPFEIVLPALIEFQGRKKDLHDEMVEMSKTLMEGPQPGVDYGKLAAHMPEITASLKYVEESIFKMTPMIGMLLISRKPDSQGHLSHLAITRKQAKEALSDLDIYFGESMDLKEQSWPTSSASVLRTILRDKGFKFADDPWE